MPKPGVYRSPWRDFPDVVIQTTVHKLRSRRRTSKQNAERASRLTSCPGISQTREDPVCVRYRRPGHAIRS
jgi:hypothetical protein